MRNSCVKLRSGCPGCKKTLSGILWIWRVTERELPVESYWLEWCCVLYWGLAWFSELHYCKALAPLPTCFVILKPFTEKSLTGVVPERHYCDCYTDLVKSNFKFKTGKFPLTNLFFFLYLVVILPLSKALYNLIQFSILQSHQ